MIFKENYEERQKWFIDRIGKIVYRNVNGCNCSGCSNIYEFGVKILDNNHAIYLRDVEGESWMDNQTGFRYFDTKEEVKEFEKAL